MLLRFVHRVTAPNIARKLWRKWRRPALHRSWQARGLLTSAQPDLATWLSSRGLAKPRLLVLIAHPDDETFCSGLIAAWVDHGCPVALACLTKGEGGQVQGVPREQIGPLREEEMRAAAEVLGIKAVHFLGYIDPPATAYRICAPRHHSGQLHRDLINAIRATQADVVLTHGGSGEYWHPAHVLLHARGKAAAKALSKPLLTMNAFAPEHPLPRILNQDDLPALVVDGTGFLARRLAALRCHQSQGHVFETHGQGGIEDFLRKTARESYALW